MHLLCAFHLWPSEVTIRSALSADWYPRDIQLEFHELLLESSTEHVRQAATEILSQRWAFEPPAGTPNSGIFGLMKVPMKADTTPHRAERNFRWSKSGLCGGSQKFSPFSWWWDRKCRMQVRMRWKELSKCIESSSQMSAVISWPEVPKLCDDRVERRWTQPLKSLIQSNLMIFSFYDTNSFHSTQLVASIPWLGLLYSNGITFNNGEWSII